MTEEANIEDFTRTFLRRLDAKLDRVGERLDDLTQVVREQGQRLSALQSDMARDIGHLHQRLDGIERRIDRVDSRLDRVERRLELVPARG
ncbi:MAG: hypothetical protein U1E53_11720 [Dongiaceae bacterium]